MRRAWALAAVLAAWSTPLGVRADVTICDSMGIVAAETGLAREICDGAAGSCTAFVQPSDLDGEPVTNCGQFCHAHGMLCATMWDAAADCAGKRKNPWNSCTHKNAGTKSGALVCECACTARGKYSRQGLLPGGPPSNELSARACRARCASVKGCVYYTFYEGLGSCQLSPDGAELERSLLPATAGPLACGPMPPTVAYAVQNDGVGACLGAPPVGEGVEGTDFRSSGPEDAALCRARCDDDDACMGYEVAAGGGAPSCELWTTAPGGATDRTDRKCFRKYSDGRLCAASGVYDDLGSSKVSVTRKLCHDADESCVVLDSYIPGTTVRGQSVASCSEYCAVFGMGCKSTHSSPGGGCIDVDAATAEAGGSCYAEWKAPEGASQSICECVPNDNPSCGSYQGTGFDCTQHAELTWARAGVLACWRRATHDSRVPIHARLACPMRSAPSAPSAPSASFTASDPPT